MTKAFREVEDRYVKAFSTSINIPVGFGLKAIAELMEKAIKRGYAITDKELDEYTKANGYIISKDILY